MYLTSKDRLAEGRFGTMFKKLPAFAPRDDLLEGLRQYLPRFVDQLTPDGRVPNEDEAQRLL